MTYQLQPGTVPYRVATWLKLQSIGAEFPSAVIAEELGILAAHIPSSLEAPVKHGVIAKRKEGALILWKLGNGIPQPRPADYEPDVPLDQLPPIKRRPERQKPLQVPVFIKGQDPAKQTAPGPQPSSPPAPPPTGSAINVEVIERLRSAALSHGEVADLLDVLADCFPFLAHGDSSFKGNDYDRSYLETVLLAAQFAAYDRGEVAKEGV